MEVNKHVAVMGEILNVGVLQCLACKCDMLMDCTRPLSVRKRAFEGSSCLPYVMLGSIAPVELMQDMDHKLHEWSVIRVFDMGKLSLFLTQIYMPDAGETIFSCPSAKLWIASRRSAFE